MNIKDVLYNAEDDYISLSKLVGKKVVDVIGYMSEEYGSPVFTVSKIMFDDDTCEYIEGEHDYPYINLESMSEDDVEDIMFQYNELMESY